MRSIRSIKKWNFTLMRSLGERAFGCGRWTSALTESFSSYVRSLIRAPLGISTPLHPQLAIR